jgi:hypothetical protein
MSKDRGRLVKEETAVIDTCEFVLENQARRVCAHVLNKMKKVFVFHTRAGLEAVLGERGDKTAAGRETLEGEALLNKGSYNSMIQ